MRKPPLRELSDLLSLAHRIVARESAPRLQQLSPAVMQLLQDYAWPGNVRQLFNVLRTACVMAAGESTITLDHLPDDFLDDLHPAAEASVPPSAPLSPSAPQPPDQAALAEPQPSAAASGPLSAPEPTRSLGDIEVDAIQRCVDAVGGNISEAAKRLGISRNTIYRKLRWAKPA